MIQDSWLPKPANPITGKIEPAAKGVKIKSIIINNPPKNKRKDKTTVNFDGGVQDINLVT